MTSTLNGTELARLSEREALQRLELLTAVSRIVTDAVDDVDEAMADVANACVPDFCDFVAVELLGGGGATALAAQRTAPACGLEIPSDWTPMGWTCTPDRVAALGFPHPEEPEPVRCARERLGADALIVAPISAGGVTLGWLITANGPYRRGFRTSALRMAVELSGRLAVVIQRVLLQRETQASAREQARTIRRLRRLAGAATSLAGAATTEAVLEVACVEACILHEAEGAIAQFWLGDGRVISARAGDIAGELAEQALTSVVNGRPARGPGWVAFPLACAGSGQRGVLTVFGRRSLSEDEELLLSSLASLIPVAFERAVGTEAAVLHEARLRAVLEASPIALIKVRADGTVFTANQAAKGLFGWSGAQAGWILPDDIRPAVLQLAADVRLSGAIANRPVVTDSLDLSVSGAPMPAIAEDHERSVILAATDLSERRRTERALIQAQRLEAMGQVSGRVAHDFNNLLTLIVGYSELLQCSVPGEREQTMLTKIDEAAKRAADLTQQMLGFTRRQLDTDAVTDFASSLNGLDAVLQRLAGACIELTVDPSTAAVKVRSDPGEVEQIILNLAINACQAMGGEGKLTISVDAVVAGEDSALALGLAPGSYARLTVADSGPGMSEETRSRCLEPFFTTKPLGEGSGLGLSTVYGLTAERGGTLSIDSEPGEGTTVEVWIPSVVDQELPAEAGEGSAWPVGKRLDGRVLVVEADDELRLVALKAMAEIGLDVIGAAQAEEVLSMPAAWQRFDVLVTDIVLPGMSGVELASRLQTARPELLVLYTTGYATPAMGVGLIPRAPLLAKPYRPDELRFRLASLLEGARPASRRGSPLPARR